MPLPKTYAYDVKIYASDVTLSAAQHTNAHATLRLDAAFESTGIYAEQSPKSTDVAACCSVRQIV